MDRLKSAIPDKLKLQIAESIEDDLQSTCSSLLNFFESLPLFHRMVSDLTNAEMALCGKNKEAALEAKAKGNECFYKGDYSNAVAFYSQALRVAPIDIEDKGRNLVATLYLNRASSFHELGLLMECLQDCSRAIMIYPAYAKAWFRRAKANASLGKRDDAISDLNVSLKIEETLSGKRQIERELNLLLKEPRLRRHVSGKSNDDSSDERLQMELKCVSTSTKGRGMVSFTDIPMASLIHREDPYAAIILKPCRESHCAFCFDELPADTVPCVSCSIPLYCSLKCQVQDGGGQDFSKYESKHGILQDFPQDLEQHVGNVTSLGIFNSDLRHPAEHKHECQGMHWSSVLPSDVVLAGRILAKYMQKENYDGSNLKIHGILDLCENYRKLTPECKLEFHVYSIILLCCLRQFFASELPLNPATSSEIIMLLSKIRINSMAIVRMKCSDGKQHLDHDRISPVEQVQVAQAVYSGGSLFNHSCQPNVHAYFLSRSLFIRASENVAAGSELELSYGPQVGQWNCSDRRSSLEEEYLFTCQCSGCAQVNLSDLVHSGYCCVRPNCFGVVVDSHVAKFEKEKHTHFKGSKTMQDYLLKDDDISRVARCIFEKTDYYDSCFEPGYCLSCGAFRDLQASQEIIADAEICIRRLQEAIADGERPNNLIMDSLKSLGTLRNFLHPFNKKIAEVEDNVAQAFCLTGELQSAMDHCLASIKILEKLYGENHIVIGNELIKLVSIQHCVGDEIIADNAKRLVAIFSRYYGWHADVVFPHLKYLKKEFCNFD